MNKNFHQGVLKVMDLLSLKIGAVLLTPRKYPTDDKLQIHCCVFTQKYKGFLEADGQIGQLLLEGEGGGGGPNVTFPATFQNFVQFPGNFL